MEAVCFQGSVRITPTPVLGMNCTVLPRFGREVEKKENSCFGEAEDLRDEMGPGESGRGAALESLWLGLWD